MLLIILLPYIRFIKLLVTLINNFKLGKVFDPLKFKPEGQVVALVVMIDAIVLSIDFSEFMTYDHGISLKLFLLFLKHC